jgi:hypothetical protein
MVFDRSSTRTLISLLQQLSEHLIFWRRLNKLSINFLNVSSILYIMLR